MSVSSQSAVKGPLRVFIAGLAHETNSFSPLPTSLRSFEEDVCYRPPSIQGREKALTFAGYGDAIAVAREHQDVVIEGPCFWTQPAGPISAALYQVLRDEILQKLSEAGRVDMVILALHGAMMAADTEDCEGDTLMRVRMLVGADVPVGAILDLHGNISRQMVASGAILVGCKEYPHVDFRPRVRELHALLTQMASRGTKLKTTVLSIPLLSLQGTTDEPMSGLVRELAATEARDGIRSVTLMHGFPWSDWEQAGASVVIVSEGTPQEQVDRIATALSERYQEIAEGSPVDRVGIEEAIQEAFSMPSAAGPVVIADSSDNPGGGAGCDSTFILKQLLEQRCGNVALGMIWDPSAARIAADAGVGAKLGLRVGGKVGPLSGDPLDLDVEVLAVRPDASQRFFSDEPNSPLGLAVGLRVQGIDIVVNSIRQQVFAPECFTELGIDVTRKRVVVVKSSQHFRASFDPIARRTIYCNAPGALNTDLSQMPYRKVHITRRAGAFGTDQLPGWIRWPDHGT